jgi:urate oxidase
MAFLTSNSYGKERVRLTKISRSEGRHEVHEYSVEIVLRGSFEEVYTKGNNTPCIPTDTMKNTVYVVASRTEFSSPEGFAHALSQQFIDRFPQIERAEISISMERWRRIVVDGKPHPHAFVKEHGRRTARIVHGRSSGNGGYPQLEGGIAGMELFKSSGSGFTGFYRDEYTTLPETGERILATTVDSRWRYAASAADAPEEGFDGAWSKVEEITTRVFATHESPSLQATLFAMGSEVVERIPIIESISFSMPNQHHILFDLDRFGIENQNRIFYGTDAPFGVINGTVSRNPAPAADPPIGDDARGSASRGVR